jgi:IS30 family transposase
VFMGKQYRHLSIDERERIAQLRNELTGLSEIARQLERDKGTISRELKRNGAPLYKSYTPCRAQHRSDERRRAASRRERLRDETIRQYVHEKLLAGWAPEQISGRLPLEHPGLSISTEAIYQYIYDAKSEDREDLIACLRRSHKKRKQRAVGRKQKKTKIPNRVSIEDRPQSVEGRRTYGHWEGDSMISRKSTFALNSLTERKSRLIMITRINRKGATETLDAVINRLGALPHKFRRTLTLDNGTENAKHEIITEGIGIKCYFAHPYASWERGTNENANGLVRWYFPKGTDFAKITDEQIATVENLLNNRPRKCLGFRTPIEVAASVVALRH